ncbi:sugar ABC transporter permease [Clostridium thermobutyricum]|uniref:Maltose transport system permease protein MalG n=1 Tax=Clostridium thermobutyricum DSM 4928 TaxID=1121339 RepID=A0A1V4STT6_9CLOT|nr:sugar ABC transporter permease [Clostridium thermobutyricum]OPX47307.1 maltose transport system permease protein MalG [Clostridium thermobutyricum DSM 4928]
MELKTNKINSIEPKSINVSNKKGKKKKYKYKRKMTKPEKVTLWLSRIFIWASILIILFPVLAIVTASLSTGSSFIQKELIPSEITFDNYIYVLKETDFLLWVWNSFKVCFFVAAAQVLMTLPAAYTFSRLRFTGKKYGLMSLLILQMFPASMALPAILSISYRLNGMDNHFFLILVMCGASAYNIWLMKGFIDGLPKELDESALVDGANHNQIFRKIIFPLCKPMLVVIFFFSFIGTFGEFVLSAALLKDPSLKTLVIGLKSFMDSGVSTNWTAYAAASVMATIPLAILFVSIQKFVSKGLVAGAVKE